jgi:hypothetical protein
MSSTRAHGWRFMDGYSRKPRSILATRGASKSSKCSEKGLVVRKGLSSPLLARYNIKAFSATSSPTLFLSAALLRPMAVSSSIHLVIKSHSVENISLPSVYDTTKCTRDGVP